MGYLNAIVWFRRDLRLKDNPALSSAFERARSVHPVFIFDPAEYAEGAASKWWLHHSIAALKRSLSEELGLELIIRKGEIGDTLGALVKETNADMLTWNRRYEPNSIKRDAELKQAFTEQNIHVESHNAGLLVEPWNILNSSKKPFQVFTPFWKSLRLAYHHQVPRALPPKRVHNQILSSQSLDDLGLLPKVPWDREFYPSWSPGELGAQNVLNDFVSGGRLKKYAQDRDFPSLSASSSLSPHLHFGEISPRQIWDSVQHKSMESSEVLLRDVEPFLRQLGWREFAHHLLYHFPHSTTQPLRTQFSRFPWKKDPLALKRWQRGKTGYPIIDAGMRELWRTGIMHNRVRMIVGSFLVKNLMQPWQLGAAWFMDTLVDADLANNTMGWQWVAGSGADAAPYFRIFNPVTQSERFDKDGEYIRRWVPELAKLPRQYIHQPWTASEVELRSYGVNLGQNYPHRIVDLKESRARALEAYRELRA